MARPRKVDIEQENEAIAEAVANMEQAEVIVREFAPEPEGVGTFRQTKAERNLELIRFYHPDGTLSHLSAPLNAEARIEVIQHYLRKRKDGGRWFYLRAEEVPGGWHPAELKWRCPVASAGRRCTRQTATMLDLYNHINAKHPVEAPIYETTLAKMRERIQQEIAPSGTLENAISA